MRIQGELTMTQLSFVSGAMVICPFTVTFTLS